MVQSMIPTMDDTIPAKSQKFDKRLTHETNISERLIFLKFLAANSVFKISRKQVDLLWEILNENSSLPYDEEALYNWLKESCEENASATLSIWDLQEIGEFFNDKFTKGDNDFANLSLDGFHCIQSYFLMCNEKNGSLKKLLSKKPQGNRQITGISSSGVITYSSYAFNRGKKDEEPVPKGPELIIYKNPSDLEGLDTIWNIIMHSSNQDVLDQAIFMLTSLYTSLDTELQEQSNKIQDNFLQTAMDYLTIASKETTKKSSQQITNVLEALTSHMSRSEVRGTGGLKPQRALLKGELLTAITVQQSISFQNLLPKKIKIALYSNNTVWDLKCMIAKLTLVTPEYVKIVRYSGSQEIEDTDNGKTLGELEFKNSESLIASKKKLTTMPDAPLTTPEGGLTIQAENIFHCWFDTFSKEGFMTPENCVDFIKSCTADNCKVTDSRIQNLFNNYDRDRDGRVTQDEFTEFYKMASLSKPEVVRSNILSHNYGNDLEIINQDNINFVEKESLPRYQLSHNNDYFNLLFTLLDRPDESSQTAWNLIQQLSTNPQTYKRILDLQLTKDGSNNVEWDKFIDSSSIYKLLYNFQIIESLMEEDSERRNTEIMSEIRAQPKTQVKKDPVVAGQGQDSDNKQQEKSDVPKPEPLRTWNVAELLQKTATKAEDEQVEKQKNDWIINFLQNDGFGYILGLFMDQQNTTNMNKFQKNFLDFMLKILRVFITAAFAANDPNLGDMIQLVRKQSTARDENEKPQEIEEQDEAYSTPVKTSGEFIGNGMVESGTGMDSDKASASDHEFSDGEIQINDVFGEDDNDLQAIMTQLVLRQMDSQVSNTSQKDKKEKKKKETEQDARIQKLSIQLKGEIGERVLSSIKFEKLQAITLDIISSLMHQETLTNEEQEIIQNAVSLWLGCILHKEEILSDFYSFKSDHFSSIEQLFMRGLNYKALVKIRVEFMNSLYVFAVKAKNEQKPPFQHILKTLLKSMNENEALDQDPNSSQFFDLVS